MTRGWCGWFCRPSAVTAELNVSFGCVKSALRFVVCCNVSGLAIGNRPSFGRRADWLGLTAAQRALVQACRASRALLMWKPGKRGCRRRIHIRYFLEVRMSTEGKSSSARRMQSAVVEAGEKDQYDRQAAYYATLAARLEGLLAEFYSSGV